MLCDCLKVFLHVEWSAYYLLICVLPFIKLWLGENTPAFLKYFMSDSSAKLFCLLSKKIQVVDLWALFCDWPIFKLKEDWLIVYFISVTRRAMRISVFSECYACWFSTEVNFGKVFSVLAIFRYIWRFCCCTLSALNFNCPFGRI